MIPPGQKDRRRQQGRRRGDRRANQIQPHEDERDHRRGEDFEESFHPQVHDPPPPVFDHRQMRVPAPRQAGAVEQGDRSGRHGQQRDELLCFAGFSQRRQQHADHQEQPQQQADHQSDLPDSAQVDVLVPLMSEVERHRVGQLVLNAQPFAGQRADDDQQQRPEQHVDAESLAFRFVIADQWADEQPGRQPRRGDPEQPHLNVPGASDAVRQPVGKREAVESVSFDTIMRRHHSQQHLHENQRRHDPEVFDRGPLRRRGFPACQRIGSGAGAFLLLRCVSRRTTRPCRRCPPAA